MSRKSIGSGARAWWHGLQPPPIGQGVGDRGAIARLRRSSTILDALSEQATHRLLRMVKADDYDTRPVVTAAMVLASVRKDDPDITVARRLGLGGEKRIISPLRFKRLVAATDPDDALSQFRRLVRMLDNRVNVFDLADSVYDWTDAVRGAQRRYRWMLDFHGALEAAEAGDADAEEQVA